MKKISVITIVTLMVIGMGASLVFAASSITWTGQGSDSMDCSKVDYENRGPDGWIHWVVTSAKDVTKAELVLGGTGTGTYEPTKVVSVLHFYTPFFELDGLTATVYYEGKLGRNAQFVISDYCPGLPLEVEKTAAGSFDRTVTWKLEKSVDPTKHEGKAGELAGSSTWTVIATKSEEKDNFMVEGEITIYNPRSFAVDFSVTDVLDDGTVADVTCPSYSVLALGTVVCTYEAFPLDDSATLNTAEVTSDLGVSKAFADVSFKENLIGFDDGTLSDPRFKYEKEISSSTTVEFPEDFYCSADANDYIDGKYSYKEENWAYLNDNIDLEASAEVEVLCKLPALEVKKDAKASYDRTVEWELDKSVAPASFSGGPGEMFSSIWTVVATKSESFGNYEVTGTISIKNPAAIAQSFIVSDVLNDGTVAAVDCDPATPGDQAFGTILAGDTKVCTYEAFPANGKATLNTATVSAVGNKDQVATAPVNFVEKLIGYDEGTLSDPRFGFSEEISSSTSETFNEDFYCPPADSGKYVDGYYKFEAVNEAFLNGNIGLKDSAKVTVECRLRFKDETAWAANGNVPLELPYGGGNWATYVAYDGEKTTNLYAGQTMLAGTVHFSAPVDGMVTITINLDSGWIFDPNVMENVKVQDYEFAPSGNPSPGTFEWKDTATGSYFSITVPENNYYGVHADVGYWY